MTARLSDDTSLTPTQIDRLHQLMDLGDSFISSDVELCQRALVESKEVRSFDDQSHSGHSTGDATGRRFSNPRYVGCGAFGIVFFVFDETLGLDVAIKLLRPSRNSTVTQQRFLEEAKITAHLSHPGIIRLYDSGTVSSIPYITSTLAGGGSLADLLSQHPAGLPPVKACELLIQIADAVAFAHSKATFHRDLKPGNILIDPDQDRPGTLRTIVSDFGLAKRWNQSTSDAGLTVAGDVLGTARYMSPEQARGDLSAFSITSEVFTLGIILFEMLTGRLPFVGASNAEIRKSIQEHIPQNIREIRGDMPKDLAAIVTQCLEKLPENRYESVGSLARDLRRFLAHEPVEAARPSVLRRLAWQAMRHPIVSTTLCASTLIVCLSLVGVSYAWWTQSQAWQREFQTKMDYIRLFRMLIDDVVMGHKDQNTVLLESLAQFESSVEKDLQTTPKNLRLRHLQSLLLNYQAVVYKRQHNYAASLRSRIDSVAILRDLRWEYPTNAKIRYQYIYGAMDMAQSLRGILTDDIRARCNSRLGWPDRDAICRDMLVETTQLIHEFPNESEFVLGCLQFRQDILPLAGQPHEGESERLADEVIQTSSQLADSHPDQPHYIKPAILAYSQRSNAELVRQQNAAALASIQEGLRYFDRYLRQHEQLPWVKVFRAQYEIVHCRALLANRLDAEAFEAAGYALQLLSGAKEPVEVYEFRLLSLQYVAAEKLNRQTVVHQLYQHLIQTASTLPPREPARGEMDWAEELHLGDEILQILKQRAEMPSVEAPMTSP